MGDQVSLIKSFAVGNGDTFYVKHGSENLTIIDCAIPDARREEILDELKEAQDSREITRVIATHPESDHVGSLHDLDDLLGIVNFYCVKNQARTDSDNQGVQRYRHLHDGKAAFYITANCTRRWMNQDSDERGSSGINVLWPDRSNDHFKAALKIAEDDGSANNICPIIRYAVKGGASALWAGDLETDFMEAIQDVVALKPTTLVFAPHHGRSSGQLPKAWLDALDPRIVVVGEADSAHLEYYSSYNTITQNSAGDIVFDCRDGKVHVHVSSNSYSVKFLDVESVAVIPGMRYIGTLTV